MSAFDVGKPHIDFLVSAGLSIPSHGERPFRWQGGELDLMTASQTGQMLVNENYRSLNARYGDSEGEAWEYSFAEVAPVAGEWYEVKNLVAVLKAVDCYEYQACETDDWQTTEAFRFCRSLTGVAVNHLPGWREGPGWPIYPDNVRQIRHGVRYLIGG